MLLPVNFLVLLLNNNGVPWYISQKIWRLLWDFTVFPCSFPHVHAYAWAWNNVHNTPTIVLPYDSFAIKTLIRCLPLGFHFSNTVEPALKDHCCDNLPVLKDHIFLQTPRRKINPVETNHSSCGAVIFIAKGWDLSKQVLLLIKTQILPFRLLTKLHTVAYHT